ncbi:MAG: thioredoxin family protein [Sandaracinaceae bacterium]|nr:thioredoxin family protein [Sandaracinaceae bacterium]
MKRRLLNAALAATPVLLVAAAARADFAAELGVEEALSSGSWGVALGIMFLGGLLTALTPCVYPMIAITVSIFGAREAKSKAHGAFLSSMYVLGICALFTPLGMVAALGGGIFGAALAEWYVVVPMAVFFIVMAAAMFGAFELALPPSIQNKLATMGGLGPKGAFVLGLVGGLIAAPCTGPVLSGLLAWIATTQSVVFGGLALFVYALGVGLPTWLVGTFAISLPKSGRWMEWVKSFFGIVMVAAALWFLKDFIGLSELVDKNWLFLGALSGMLLIGLALGAVHLSYHGAGKGTIARKTTGIVLSVVGAAGIAMWLNAAPETASANGATHAEIEWMTSYEEARELAQREGRPLLVDFGASWCQACQELERNTFSDPRVVAEGRRFVPVRVDLSPGQDVRRGQQLLAQYNQHGLPLVVLHGSNGEEVDRVTGFIDADAMLDKLRRVD